MAIATPFDLSAAIVPKSVDLMDISAGDGAELQAFISDCDADDVVSSLYFVAKRDVSDSDIAVTTIRKTITTTPSAAGVLAQLTDRTVWEGKFTFSAIESVRLAARVYTYAIRATVVRAGTTYTRIVQTGLINAQSEASDFGSPYANGEFFADGEIFADGLPSS